MHLQISGPSLGDGSILAESRVQVIGDLIEISLGLLHLLHVLPQEDGEVLGDAPVGLVDEHVLVLGDLLQGVDHLVEAAGGVGLLVGAEVGGHLWMRVSECPGGEKGVT